MTAQASPEGNRPASDRGDTPARYPLGFCLIGVLLILLLLWTLLLSLNLRSALRHARQAQSFGAALFESAQGNGTADPAALSALSSSLRGLYRSLRILNTFASGPGCAVAAQSLWPAAHQAGALACDGLPLATELAHTAYTAALALSAAPAGGELSFQASATRQALETLGSQRERLLALYPHAERLAALEGPLPVPERLSGALALAPELLDALLLAPQVLGGTTERTILLLFQNSDELRPTGGFISSVLVLHLRGGRLDTYEYMNSYNVETDQYRMPDPPEPLGRYMRLGGLVFRDGNWSPDFPTSAQVLAALYQASRGVTVDGIVAVDTPMLQMLLEATGPIDVPQYGVSISAASLLETAEGYWENPVDGTPIRHRETNIWGWLDHRKDFGGVFADAVVSRLKQLDSGAMLRLAEALVRGRDGKHIQAWWLSGTLAQADLSRSGFSGSLSDAAGDYLMVVDANLGYNKVDRNIQREVLYRVSFTSGSPWAELVLTYHHRSPATGIACVQDARILDSYEALTELCYWDYVRVLLPAGAEFVESVGSDYPIDRTTEGTRQSLGTLLVVPPGESRSLTLRYRLPGSALACEGALCRYTLTIQKQSGVQATDYSFASDVSPLALSAAGWEMDGSPWPVSFALTGDGSLSLAFPLDAMGAR